MFLVSDRDKFSNWLEGELSRRRWSQADLSRITGVHRAIVSKLILSQTTPQPDTLIALAKGMELPVEEVFRAAGVLPASPSERPLVRRLMHLLNQLDDEDLEVEEAAIRARIERKGERQHSEKNRGRRASES